MAAVCSPKPGNPPEKLEELAPPVRLVVACRIWLGQNKDGRSVMAGTDTDSSYPFSLHTWELCSQCELQTAARSHVTKSWKWDVSSRAAGNFQFSALRGSCASSLSHLSPGGCGGGACSTGFGHAGKARPQNMVEQDRRTGPRPESQDAYQFTQFMKEKNPTFVKLLLFDSNKNNWIDTGLRGVQIKKKKS